MTSHQWDITIPDWSEGKPLRIVGIVAGSREEAEGKVVVWINSIAGGPYCDRLPDETLYTRDGAAWEFLPESVKDEYPPPWRYCSRCGKRLIPEDVRRLLRRTHPDPSVWCLCGAEPQED